MPLLYLLKYSSYMIIAYINDVCRIIANSTIIKILHVFKRYALRDIVNIFIEVYLLEFSFFAR